jgi:hypothetical protein
MIQKAGAGLYRAKADYRQIKDKTIFLAALAPLLCPAF